jgi:hypothetical protein
VAMRGSGIMTVEAVEESELVMVDSV